METIEALQQRRSNRLFLDKQISQDELNAILQCGLNAPSGKNKQDTRLVVIQDKETLKELSKLNAFIMKTESDPFYHAPTLIIVFAPQDSVNRIKDGSAVLTNLQNGAYALNIGSCWINRAKEMFELSEGKKYLDKWHLTGYEGIGCCVLGYNQKEPQQIKRKENRIIFD